jgi:hypothetical protein
VEKSSASEDCMLAAEAVGARVDEDGIVTIEDHSPRAWLLERREERLDGLDHRTRGPRLFQWKNQVLDPSFDQPREDAGAIDVVRAALACSRRESQT